MLSRKEWYMQRFYPLFNKLHPEIYVTFDIFTNKSREYGFDHRTKNANLRECAKILAKAEQSAIAGSAEDDLLVVEIFLAFIHAEGAIAPHKTAKTKKSPKLDYDKIKEVLPNFSEFDFKVWSAAPEGDHEQVQTLKKSFREAYKALSDGDSKPLIDWQVAEKAMYKGGHIL